MFALLNGTQVREGMVHLTPANRAFCYGDGVFESMCIHNGKLLFADLHIQRSVAALKALEIVPPPFMASINYAIAPNAAASLEQMAMHLYRKNRYDNFARVRLHLYRGGGGFYAPTNNTCEWLLVTMPLASNHYGWNTKGLHMDYYSGMYKQFGMLSGFKTANSALYVMAAKYAADNLLDDVIILNNKNHVVETSKANLFLVVDGMIITPKMKGGPTAGVMRAYLMLVLLKNKIPFAERLVTQSLINDAEEIFSTNVSSGVKWVERIGKRKYGKKKTKAVHEALIESLK